MRLSWKELTVPVPPDSHRLLADWHWLIGSDMQIVLISALGEAFLKDAGGRVYWLQAGYGRVSRIADSVVEFDKLRQISENADEWFVPQLVGDLIAGGVTLSPGQCYGFRLPPVLSGELEPENLEPTDLVVHFAILGQICRQSKDLPEGTQITGFTMDGSEP